MSNRFITATFSGGVNRPWLTDNLELVYYYKTRQQAFDQMVFVVLLHQTTK